MTTSRNEEHGRGDPSSKGKNLGQGLAGLRDDQRRDLVGRGGRTPTEDQRGVSTTGEQDAPGGSDDGNDQERR